MNRVSTTPKSSSGNKGLPNKKISQYVLWGGHLVRPVYVAGKMPAPQDGIIYFLEIPKETGQARCLPHVTIQNSK
ncbi:hypothetical protein FDUTEX481_05109 [Tolypothrix sp. PCC 7601]|nr:hypothetical protein FDUTEX481_05109 [Tolypothrix sp. PCC 7601]BAY90105.1 hypothetical protein NIES3275_21150 [Microchaete diplosiphon NIES-3275]